MNAAANLTAPDMESIAGLALGIDIGGTRVKFAWFDAESGALRGTRIFPTEDCLNEDGAPRFAADIRTYIADAERELGVSFLTIGLAAPGLAAPDQSMIVSMPGRLAGLVGLDWTRLLGRTDLVPVLNDGHAALLGEVWQGAAKGWRDVVLLTLGTGVGGAILSNGALLRGASGGAGHLGHVCLNPDGPTDIVGTPGSLEDAIGECSLGRRTEGRFERTRDLLAAVNSGDTKAAQQWHTSIQALAAAIVSFINTLDPELIVIGGGVAQAGDELLVPLRKRVAAMEWRPVGNGVPIVSANLGEMGGATGAAKAALSARPGKKP